VAGRSTRPARPRSRFSWLGLWVRPTTGESAKFWLTVLSELKSRGGAEGLLAELRALTRDRERLAWNQRGTENELRAIVMAYHPAVLELFFSLDRDISLFADQLDLLNKQIRAITRDPRLLTGHPGRGAVPQLPRHGTDHRRDNARRDERGPRGPRPRTRCWPKPEQRQ